ncbi:DoxX family membrane protein [Corallococcus sp. CA053C]|uniref:DoxX family membrane protein n=1 Tax=Corallococcus sp. CA053C TaxID=2316732 RepID=UPI000EA2495B|nr:DoxX family membrane protein [Corallococcus sp. CA053C]RKH12526.1 DoxX family membrane protein [Corallococcus sp. CA053C]
MRAATSSMSQAVEGLPSKSMTRHLPTAARLLMGLVFFVFGLNGFLNFIPAPSNQPEGAMAFGMAMMKTGYLFPLLKGTELLVGVLLLANRFVPLALALIAPVIVNIFMFHAFLAPAGIAIALILLALELSLAWSFRAAYRPMLAMRATPRA